MKNPLLQNVKIDLQPYEDVDRFILCFEGQCFLVEQESYYFTDLPGTLVVPITPTQAARIIEADSEES